MKNLFLNEFIKPFPFHELQWRVFNVKFIAGEPIVSVVPYVSTRLIAGRLDEVVGQENWTDEYTPIPNGFLCTLSIRIENEWISKRDGAGYTNVEPTKGGISEAFKRAAVKWGIGRYLYTINPIVVQRCEEEVADFGEVIQLPTSKLSYTFWWKVPSPEEVRRQGASILLNEV